MSRAFIWFILIKYHSFPINKKLSRFCWLHLGIIDHRGLAFMTSLMWDIDKHLRKPEEFNLDFVQPAGKVMLPIWFGYILCESIVRVKQTAMGLLRYRASELLNIEQGEGEGPLLRDRKENGKQYSIQTLWFTYKYCSDIAQRRNDLWRDYSCILSHIYAIQSLNLLYS